MDEGKLESLEHLRLWQEEEIEADAMNLSKYPCPCMECAGGKVLDRRTIRKHLRIKGRDPAFTASILDDYAPVDLRIPRQRGFERKDMHVKPSRNVGEVEVLRMVTECFNKYDNINVSGQGIENIMRESMEGASDNDPCGVDNFAMPYSVNENDGMDANNDPMEREGTSTYVKDATGVNMEVLLREAQTPLYEGSTSNRLTSTLMLLVSCTTFGVPNSFVDELLKLLKETILPKDNALPKSFYEAKTLLMKLGLSYNSIHACRDGCCLFRKELQDAVECPSCHKSRYIQNSSTIPVKVLRHFPLIPRLRRMYSNTQLADLMRWHVHGKSKDKVMRSVVDSKAWDHVNNKWPWFAEEQRNVRLGLALDGVNPFQNQSLSHSTWPVIMLNYNLPPWLVTKNFFMMLTLIIPGKESVSEKNIDVYLAPLIEELQMLWKGVDCFDGSCRNSPNEAFKLHGILMWTVNDFPAYGLISGQVTKGYRACPVCGANVVTRRSKALKKNIYLGHRRYLPMSHQWRWQRARFDGKADMKPPPRRMSGREQLRYAEDREEWMKNDHVKGVEQTADPVHEHGVKRRTCLYDLPYWKDLLIRHTLDVMHCEKNIADSILKVLCGEKDSLEVRLDMKEAGIRKHLWPIPGKKAGSVILPHSSYTFTKEERQIFVDGIRSLRTPTQYMGQLKKRVHMDGSIKGLKSHDYHVLMQQVLPLCVRTVLAKEVRTAIIMLSRIFKRICAKTIDPNAIAEMRSDVAITLCMLEKEFPPSFFDIMSHLLIHLVEEVEICGPVHTRWMYPIERYLKTLKGYVRNRARPEGSMAEGYVVVEALGFCTEYMQEYTVTTRRVWDDKEDPSMYDEILEGSGRLRHLSVDLRQWIHEFVINNAAPLEDWRRRYEDDMSSRERERQQYRRKKRKSRIEYPLEMCNEEFHIWFPKAVVLAIEGGTEQVHEDVRALMLPPSDRAKSYRSMYAFGNHIRVRSCEKQLTTMDSGVAATFQQLCRAGIKDKNMKASELEYVGWVEEILSVDYGHFEVVVLYCNWVVANMKGDSATMKRDEYGFTSVNFDRLIQYSAQSFAFPLHIEQVFFAPDKAKNGWEVVLRKEPRGVRVFSTHQGTKEVECISLGKTEDFEGLEATGLYEDLLPMTPILRDAIEVEPNVVATTLQRIRQDVIHVEDMQYTDADSE